MDHSGYTMVHVVMYLTCRERDALLSMHVIHYDTSGHVFNVQWITCIESRVSRSLHVEYMTTWTIVDNVHREKSVTLPAR
jgi:hypothetical protein